MWEDMTKEAQGAMTDCLDIFGKWARRGAIMGQIKDKYGTTRDELYFKMKEQNVLGRRYFYPLISTFSTYRGLETANPANLPEAHKMADSVICLPMHHALSNEDIQRTIDLIVR